MPLPRSQLALPGAIIAVTLVLATALAVSPILVFPLPPLEDYPNHLARMHVILNVGADPDLSRYYEIHWQIIPNLVMDLVVPPLARVSDLFHAGQAFTAICFLLVATGIFALNRALFGGWSLSGLLALPFLYNHVFLVGLLNYLFGIGLAMWGMSAWALLRERPWPWRLVASTLFAVALFFSHLIAVGVYAIALLAFESWRGWKRRSTPPAVRLADLAAAGLPFLPVLALLLASPTSGLGGQNEWSLTAKIEGLSYIFSTYSDVVDFALAAAACALVTWAALRRKLRVHPAAWALLGLGAIVYVALPNVTGTAFLVDQRLPVAIVLMAIAFTSIEPPRRLADCGAMAALLALLAVRVGDVYVNWTDLSRQIADVRTSMRLIERGARVLVAQSGDDDSDGAATDYGLTHAGCFAIIERSALVTDAFVFPGKQIMRVRPAHRRLAESADGDLPYIEDLVDDDSMRARSGDGDPYWQQWQDNFDYLYLVYTRRGDANPLAKFLTLLHDGERFQLYKVRRAGS